MPNIRPISDLRNHANEISSLCHELGEPIFITKKGKEDLVVMSQAAYEEQQARLELYERLEEAHIYKGKAISHKEMMGALRKRL